MEYTFEITWRGQKVGGIENGRPDMWYLEGTWVSDNTSRSIEFERLVGSFDAKAVMLHPERGTRVVLADRDNDQETHALIISLADGLLFLRQVFDSEAVNWLLKNVK